MAFKYLGDGTLKGNLSVDSNKPLDTRQVVDTLADLYAISSGVAYVGMPVVVVGESAMYILTDISGIASEAGWKKVGTVNISTDSGGTVDLDSILSSYATKDYVASAVGDKQAALVSGENIKTVNGESLLGSGNIVIEGGGGGSSDVDLSGYATKEEVEAKQDKLVSGTNIKTINGQSVLGSGDITIDGSSDVDLSGYATKEDLSSAVSGKQDTLVSGENVKTINGKSILGEGDIIVGSETDITIDTSEFVKTDGLKTVNGQSLVGSGDITIEAGSEVEVDSEVTQYSDNPVRSSGVYKAINAKCVFLTSEEYDAMSTHDANVFYFIKDD